MISTDRLLLRRWRDADREPFAAMNADPAVMEHMQDPAGDFDHPNVDAVAYPHLIPHVFYRLSREAWLAIARSG